MPTKNRLSISEARRMLTELVDRAAYQRKEFIITRNGKAMARIVPMAEAQSEFVKLVRATVADSKDILRELE
ncbi:MAG TPA: type II toxin-antitoxin system prevent-host-death family antitoxin [Myxococcota bacterium]|nr:type II toxin-antitoxin system prevent-host-death family antitoxin [Myxococcota bacterium]